MSVMLISVAIIFVGFWFFQGGRVLAVASGSMQPTLSVGDAVLVQKSSTSTLLTGEIISFRSTKNPNIIITHRIIGRQGSNFITQGDALATPDPTISGSQIIGRASAVAPKLGAVMAKMHQPQMLGALIGVPAAWLVIIELSRLSRHWRPITYRYYRG